jgi:hypothetical protein
MPEGEVQTESGKTEQAEPENKKEVAVKEKEEAKKPDYFARLTAVASLAVSLATTYLTLFLQKDDVRMVVGPVVDLYRDDRGTLTSSGEQQVTVLNAGNRTIVIQNVNAEAISRKGEKDNPSSCKDDGKTGLPIQFIFNSKPTIIEPGKVGVIEGKVSQPFWAPDPEGRDVQVYKSAHLWKAVRPLSRLLQRVSDNAGRARALGSSTIHVC